MADVLNGHNGHAEPAHLELVPPPGPQDPEPDVITGVVIPPPDSGDMPAGEHTRAPVVPEPLRRENIRGTVSYWAGLHWHRVRYHALRFPWYVPLFLFYAARGAHRLNKRVWTWWHWTEGWHWESLSVAAGRSGYHDGMRAHVEGKKTRASPGAHRRRHRSRRHRADTGGSAVRAAVGHPGPRCGGVPVPGPPRPPCREAAAVPRCR